MKRSLIIVLSLGLLLLVARPGKAAVTCGFDAATGTVTLTSGAANEELKVARSVDNITVESRTSPTAAFAPVTCTGSTPTVTTTDKIVMTGTAANNQDLRIDLAGGPLAPGKTVTGEAPGAPEIEIDVSLGEPAAGAAADSGDGIIVSGSTGADVVTLGVNGADLNADGDIDIGPLVGADDAAGDRQLLGQDGDDILSAAGNPVTGASALATTLNGGNGTDTLTGGDKADTQTGGAGTDTLTGGADVDTLSGDAGTDTLNGGVGNDTLNGGTENDTLNGDAGNDTLNGEAGIDTVNGGTEDDTLNGGDGNDIESGDDGNDVFEQGAGLPNGADVLNGGLGRDEVRYLGRGRRVTVTLDGVANDGDPAAPGEGDNVGADSQLESALGTLYDDTLTGNALNNVLSGNAGKDTLTGGPGNDTLNGGADADVENGEAGNDTFDQEAAANGADVMAGGADADIADYSKRANLVTVTRDGTANDGEAGEADNVGNDIESAPPPGSGPPSTTPPGQTPQPALVGSSNLGGQGLNGEVAVTGDTAIVAGGYVPTNTQSNAHIKLMALNTAPPCVTVPVKVVDLTDPSRPRVAATIPVPEGQAARDVDILNVDTPSFRGDLAAVALATCKFDEEELLQRGLAAQGSYADRGVVYYDVTNPNSPRFLSRYFTDFDNVNPDAPPCGPKNDSRCAKDQFSVQLRRIRDGRILSLSTKIDARDVNSPTGDVRLVDVTNPTVPIQVSSWPELGEDPPRTSNNGCYPNGGSRGAEFSTDGTKVYVPYLDGGLFTLNIEDLANPTADPAKGGGRWSYPQDWNVEGNGAYVAQTDVGGRKLALLADEDWIGPTSAFQVEAPTNLAGVNPGCSDLFTSVDLGFDSQISSRPGRRLPGELVYIGRGCPAAKAPDGTTTSPADPYLVPEGDVNGKLVLADRNLNTAIQPGLLNVPPGPCTFNSRVRRAQDLGALGVVLITAAGVPESVAGFPPVGSPRTQFDQNLRPTGDLSIPGFQIKRPIGEALRTAMCPATSGTPRRCTGGVPGRGTLVDLAGEWGGLRVIDVTNPAKPNQVSIYRTANAQVFPPPDIRKVYSVHHAVVQGSTAYVAWNSDGLRVLDLTGAQPRETFSFVPPDTVDPTGTLPAKAYVQGVAISPRHVVISDVNSGIYVFSSGNAVAATGGSGAAVGSETGDGNANAGASGSTSGRGSGTRGKLPKTGSNVLRLVLLGLVLLCLGAAVVQAARKRRGKGGGPSGDGGQPGIPSSSDAALRGRHATSAGSNTFMLVVTLLAGSAVALLGSRRGGRGGRRSA